MTVRRRSKGCQLSKYCEIKGAQIGSPSYNFSHGWQSRGWLPHFVPRFGVVMSKPEWLGMLALGCGAIFGFISGGALGYLLASACLVVGLVLMVASTALGIDRKPGASSSTDKSKTHLLVLLKEVHARPQKSGKFQEISSPDQAGLQFEVFVHCWLVNDTDERLGIADTRLSMTKPDGTPVTLDRITGDMDSWRLGRLRDELDTWGVRYLQAAQESMPELRAQDPLEGGSTRQGWIHVRAEGITPAELKNANVELEVIDSHLQSHIGAAKGPHPIPGRVWPFRQEPKTAAVPQIALPPDAPHPSLG